MDTVTADYQRLEVASSPSVDLPTDKRVAFGWAAAALPPSGDPLHLRPPADLPTGAARLRVTVALDSREVARVAVALAESGQAVGELDVRYSSALHPYELLIGADMVDAARREGLMLRLAAGEAPLWLYTDAPEDAAPLAPHLLFSATPDPLAQFFARLNSPASIMPWGWLEGCVLDALYHLDAALPNAGFGRGLARHLALYHVPEGRLIYEDPRSRPVDDRTYGIEGTLPLAILARIQPDHPILDDALAFWAGTEAAGGVVTDGASITAEGSYTIAYPMAVLSVIRGDPALAERARAQVAARAAHLWADGALWLRHHPDGSYTLRNWARGWAWHLLGAARTLATLGIDDASAEITTDFARLAGVIIGYQRADGLWNCFVDDPAGTPDTSGSAGIAAALTLGHQLGILPYAGREAALRAVDGLRPYLTPDGLLTGVAQMNKGGEALQRADYRVISGMGMGLMGQLLALLLPVESAG